jgi:hypothetical protein
LSVWIPIFTGLMALLGAVAGHFLAFELSAAAKRREVIRAQIERFAELVSEDVTWMHKYRIALLFEEGQAWDASPYDKAYAVCMLYFADKLREEIVALVETRHAFVRAIDDTYSGRLNRGIAAGQPLKSSRPTQAEVAAVAEAYVPYYRAVRECVRSSSSIVQETIPETSPMVIRIKSYWSKAVRRIKS